MALQAPNGGLPCEAVKARSRRGQREALFVATSFRFDLIADPSSELGRQGRAKGRIGEVGLSNIEWCWGYTAAARKQRGISELRPNLQCRPQYRHELLSSVTLVKTVKRFKR